MKLYNSITAGLVGLVGLAGVAGCRTETGVVVDGQDYSCKHGKPPLIAESRFEIESGAQQAEYTESSNERRFTLSWKRHSLEITSK